MRPFSDLTQEFSNWIQENNINYNHEEYVKYIWEVPKKAVDQWKTELDDYRELFTDEVYQTYINQFELNGAILGIYNVVFDDSTTAKLYKLTSSYKEFSINDILVSKLVQLPIPPNKITLPDGKSVNLPTSIEHGTLKLFYPDSENPLNEDNSIDLIDATLSNVSRGSLAGYGFSIGDRDDIELNHNSFLASVNYQTGILHIIRNNNPNEEKFIKYYKWLLDEIRHSSSHSCPTGGTSSSGGTGTSFSSIHSLSQVTPYNYISVSGSFFSLGTPLTLVFSFDCEPKPQTIDDKEYNELVSYSSNQEIIIQNIQKELADSMKEQQNIINTYSNNYDFQLGSRINNLS